MSESELNKLGRFIIQSELGRGGFATVYRALDPNLDREVALKVLHPMLLSDPSFTARFRREAKALAALRHSNIVTVYEVNEADGRLFIAMELADGPSLAGYITERGGLPWQEVRKLIKPVCDALDYAHSQGVVHRDLKPANIMVDRQRGPLMTDFGLARLLSNSSASVSMTMSGGILGTPAYIAPEVWEMEAAGPTADIYALGCILHEMLTGELLFNGQTPMHIMRAHDKGPSFPTTWPKEVPAGIEAVLLKSLARLPQERYPSAGSLWQAMDDVEDEARSAAEQAQQAALAAEWQVEARRALAEGEWSVAKMAVGRWLTILPGDSDALEIRAEIERRQAGNQVVVEPVSAEIERQASEQAAREEAARQQEAREAAEREAAARETAEREAAARREAESRAAADRKLREEVNRQQPVQPEPSLNAEARVMEQHPDPAQSVVDAISAQESISQTQTSAPDSAQMPRQTPAAVEKPARPRSKKGIWIGVGVLALIGVIAVILFALSGDLLAPPTPEPAVSDASMDDEDSSISELPQEGVVVDAGDQPVAVEPSATATEPLVPTATEEPVIEPTSVVVDTQAFEPFPFFDGTLIFEDDFSDVTSGWTNSVGRNTFEYRSGTYAISIFDDSHAAWSYLGDDLGDVLISVDTAVTEPTGLGDYGVVCRVVDDANFYAFFISEDGFFAIYKYENGEWVILHDWEFSEAIPAGEPFRIDAACIGGEMLLGVDGILLGGTVDDTFAGGQYGLIAETGDQGNLAVEFDNIEVFAVGDAALSAPGGDEEFASLKENASILIYEVMGNQFGVREALDALGYTNYTYVGQAPGDFHNQLTSETYWDLIIVGAEAGDSMVFGDSWGIVYERVNEGAALVAEVTNLESIANGRIKNLTTDCGIRFQQDLPGAQDIFLLMPNHPIFNQPNIIESIRRQSFLPKAGDLFSLRADSQAELIAGTQETRVSDYGQIASCYDGRVIFQTFSKNDYREADINPLWQNYIDYSLENHFRMLFGE